MSNAGRWQAVDPEPGAPRAQPTSPAGAEPDPTPEAEAGADLVVDVAGAERAEPHPSEPRRAEVPVGTVEIEAVLTEDEFRQLLAAAAEAGKTPNDFLRQAVRDAWFFQRNAPPGSKILIVSGGKVHTVR